MKANRWWLNHRIHKYPRTCFLSSLFSLQVFCTCCSEQCDAGSIPCRPRTAETASDPPGAPSPPPHPLLTPSSPSSCCCSSVHFTVCVFFFIRFQAGSGLVQGQEALTAGRAAAPPPQKKREETRDLTEVQERRKQRGRDWTGQGWFSLCVVHMLKQKHPDDPSTRSPHDQWAANNYLLYRFISFRNSSVNCLVWKMSITESEVEELLRFFTSVKVLIPQCFLVSKGTKVFAPKYT